MGGLDEAVDLDIDISPMQRRTRKIRRYRPEAPESELSGPPPLVVRDGFLPYHPDVQTNSAANVSFLYGTVAQLGKKSPIGIRCLQKLSSSEEARISISFLSRYPCPSYDFSRPPVSTDTEEHWRTLGFRSAIDSRSNTIRYGRKNHGSSTSSTPALWATTTTTTKKNE